MEAFPFDHSRMCADTLAYEEDPDGCGLGHQQPPYDAFMGDWLLLHYHMRLAFEENADWLVEVLEGEREKVADRADYALALSREVGDRPTG